MKTTLALFLIGLMIVLASIANCGCGSFRGTTINLGFERQDTTCNAVLSAFGQQLQQQVPSFFCDNPFLRGLHFEYDLSLRNDTLHVDTVRIVK